MKTSKVMEELYRIKEELSLRHLTQTTKEWVRESNEIAKRGAARLESARADIAERESITGA